MHNFLWNPAWETGAARIDDQHRELFRRMGLLSISLIEGKEQAETGKVLIHLREYVEFHFSAEEALMANIEFPGIDRHKGIHDDMRSQVNSLVNAYMSDQPLVPSTVMEFLVTWLLDHIDKEDRALAEFLHRHTG